jgi:DMSO reductase family type II enzyme heme b subunit
MMGRRDMRADAAIVKRLALAVGLAGLLGLAASGAGAADRAKNPMPKATPEFIAQGKDIYFRRCSFCHGLLGDGNGPAADFMDPRPRDFTLGTFKFRTTQSGELPTDADLFRTVSRGLSGTGMQAFDGDLVKSGLSEEQRWAVIAYIKTFAQEFDDPEIDPIKTGKVINLPDDRPAYSEEIVAKGKAVFERAKCWECHGKQGRGDGQKSFDRKDDWGFPIRIRNVTHPWKIKGGTAVEDIYMRFSTGINGTPMPSFVKALSVEDRWYLANFIKSLQHKRTDHQVLKAMPTDGAVPDAPDAAVWKSAEPMDVRLTGQVVGAPRWQNPSIELATMRAVYNDKEIAFLIEWDDAFKDATHKTEAELDAKAIRKVGAFNSYVAANGMVTRKLDTFRDAIALQFPIKAPEGTKKPHFFRGDASNPVNLWVWKADLDAGGKRAVEEAVARGWRQPPRVQAEDQQQAAAKAVWSKGRWSVVLKRPRMTGDKSDVQFVEGRFIPMSVNAWDGSNGEHGLIMSLSTWHYVFIEAPTPSSVYVYAILAVLVVGALGIWLSQKARREEENAGNTVG